MSRLRHRAFPRRALVALALVVVATTSLAAVAAAQTTVPTTAPPATTTPTVAPPTTTVPSGSPTTAPTTATTAGGGGANADSDDDFPWVPIAAAAVVLVLLVVLVAALARRRGAKRQAVADWRRQAADVTAEAGAMARLLSTGTPPSGQIAQQVLTSLRGFEDLARSAPDRAGADTAERARRALQSLGLAIDADYRFRRSEPAPSAQQVAQSQDSVRTTAAETDRTLRSVYRTFTDAS